MTEEEMINRAIIGKRVVAIAWVPVLALPGHFVLSSITFEGGTTLEFQGADGDAVFVRLKESDHEP